MFILVIEIASQFNSFYRRDYQLKSLLLLSVINILTCQRHIFLFFFFFVWVGGGGGVEARGGRNNLGKGRGCALGHAY